MEKELSKLLQEIRFSSGMSPHNFALALFTAYGVLDAAEMTQRLLSDAKEVERCKRVVNQLEDIKVSVSMAINQLNREE